MANFLKTSAAIIGMSLLILSSCMPKPHQRNGFEDMQGESIKDSTFAVKALYNVPSVGQRLYVVTLDSVEYIIYNNTIIKK